MSATLFSEEDLADWNVRYEGSPPQAILAWVFDRFGSNVTMAWGGGYEGMAMLDMVMRLNPSLRVFTLNTEMLFPETLELLRRCEDRYDIRIVQYRPEPEQCKDMVARYGLELYRRSVDLRKFCCRVRKVEPMRRALSGFQGWLTALTRFQSAGRNGTQIFSIDNNHVEEGIIKICPLATWPPEKIWAYIRENNVPYHSLHDAGYRSIGCRPCTREHRLGEGDREERWWWEEPINFGGENAKECGLHAMKNGPLITIEKV